MPCSPSKLLITHAFTLYIHLPTNILLPGNGEKEEVISVKAKAHSLITIFDRDWLISTQLLRLQGRMTSHPFRLRVSLFISMLEEEMSYQPNYTSLLYMNNLQGGDTITNIIKKRSTLLFKLCECSLATLETMLPYKLDQHHLFLKYFTLQKYKIR